MKVTFTLAAERQVEALHRYIAVRADEDRADGYINRIVAFCEGLRTFPQRGHPRDDLIPGLRVVGFERRVSIAFMIMDGQVLIEGVFYGGQSIEGHLRPD